MGPQPQRFFNQAQANVRGAQPRRPQQPRGAVPPGQMQMGMNPGFRTRGPAGPRGMNQAQAAAAAAQAAQAAAVKQNVPRANYKYAPGVRNPAQNMAMVGPQPIPQQQPQPAVLIQGQEPLTASMLAAAPPQEQ